jgi:hypothetical protein
MWLIVLGSSIWVLVDAKNIGVKKGLIPGIGNIGPWGWFFATLLLWIIGFPMYLYYRGKFKLAVAEANGVVSPRSGSGKTAEAERSAIGDLEKLAALKEKGIITDSEFQAKKKQLLGL